MPHDHSPHPASISRDSADYWNKRAATFTRYATEDYELWLMDSTLPRARRHDLGHGLRDGHSCCPPR